MHKKLRIGIITKYTEGTYHGRLLSGIYNCLKDMDAKLFVINTYMISRFFTDKKKVESYYNVAQNHIDGWIIFAEGASEHHIEDMLGKDKPIVFIGTNSYNTESTIIKSDNVFGAKKAVEHLITHGHRKIGFIGWMDMNYMKERFHGYKEALQDHGIPFDEELVFSTDYELPRYGKQAVEHWIKNGIEFSSIFAGNDGLAYGAIKELVNCGISVPEKVAVIGYDNSSFSENSNPGITTIDQNIYEMGFVAAKSLVAKIENKGLTEKNIFGKTDLIIRSSCGCAYANNSSLDLTKENIYKKDSIIKYLEETILKNSEIGTRLLTTDINGIKKLLPYIIDEYTWECIGLWDNKKFDQSNIYIKALYDISRNLEETYKSCKLENFPPLDILEDKEYLYSDDIIWIMPISSTTGNWGLMAYSNPYNEMSSMVRYNISTVITTLLGIAMDRDAAKTDLEIALETLKQTQQQLIHSEKMAAFGGLVAGLAHEINTPVGISVTAASHLFDKNEELINLFEAGKLKKDDLVKYIDTVMNANEIITLNLERASNLIKSFEQITEDKSVIEKKRFRLKAYFNEVIFSLEPKIKVKNHKVIVECSEDLEIHASPIGLSQIITNLVDNSLIHAFEDMEEGVMEISAAKENNEIIIRFGDNGKGISEGDLKKIYEPFFTTKRGKGGTGLGLHLVYNIVTNEYKGSIECKSALSKGTTFIIKIPVA